LSSSSAKSALHWIVKIINLGCLLKIFMVLGLLQKKVSWFRVSTEATVKEKI
jgi:hypothetical protein